MGHILATVDRESLMIGLLDACAQHLRTQGMKSLFLDTVRNHLEWFEELGEFMSSPAPATNTL